MRLIGLFIAVFGLTVAVSLMSYWLEDELICKPKGLHYMAHKGCVK